MIATLLIGRSLLERRRQIHNVATITIPPTIITGPTRTWISRDRRAVLRTMATPEKAPVQQRRAQIALKWKGPLVPSGSPGALASAIALSGDGLSSAIPEVRGWAITVA